MKWHHNLDVWKRSIELVVEIYKVTDTFPRHEVYGLTQQMRRAAVTIPSNIAEGAARKSSKEFIQFLSTAQGSIAELETQLIIADKLKYLKQASVLLKELNELSLMTAGLQGTIKKKAGKG
ncbi:MAG: four helix bundle protein [Nitrospirota bacterium]|nr:four helix bundle protein [Nitrospirota bacterium]